MRPKANLDTALHALFGAAREYAHLRTRASVRASLQRVLEEAAITLAPATRQQIDRALGAPEAQTPLVAWIGLLAEGRRAVEQDMGARAERLLEETLKHGALLEAPGLSRILALLEEDADALQDLGALLDRRRALSLSEAEIDRRVAEVRKSWEQARAGADALPTGVADAAEAGIAAGDLLPAAEALDRLTAARRAAEGAKEPLEEERRALDAAVDAAAEFLAPEEVEWARGAARRCPARGMEEGGAASAAWSGALGTIAGTVATLAATRRESLARLEARLAAAGGPADGPPAAGFRRLRLLREGLRERRGAADGGLEAARARCLETEWDLSRAVWEDGPLASLAAALEARAAFLECHGVRDLPLEAPIAAAAERAASVAARVRREARWRRRAPGNPALRGGAV